MTTDKLSEEKYSENVIKFEMFPSNTTAVVEDNEKKETVTATVVETGVELADGTAKKESSSDRIDASSGGCSRRSRHLKGSSRGSSNDLESEEIMQDLYGSRSYSVGTSRPTMISAKYRQKEERRKLLKMSMNKLKRMDDQDFSLLRSLLIGSVVKRIQRESKEEKSQCSHSHSVTTTTTAAATVPSSPQSRCFGITNDFITKQDEKLQSTADIFSATTTSPFNNASSRTASPELCDITNTRDTKSLSSCMKDTGSDDPSAGMADCNAALIVDVPMLASAVDAAISSSSAPSISSDKSLKSSSANCCKKRTLDEVLDEEVDVLSQFCLPTQQLPPLQTTTLLQCSSSVDATFVVNSVSSSVAAATIDDEDEDVNVVDVDIPSDGGLIMDDDFEHSIKRRRSNMEYCQLTLTAADRLRDNLPNFFSVSTSSSYPEDWPMDDNMFLFSPPMSPMCPPAPPPSPQNGSSFSCGHSSILNEIVVYHNLIASLES